MNNIFISYRRQDSAAYAGRLYDHLVKRYGPDRIFFDVAALDPGADFRRQLREVVASAQVILVLIGPEWVTATDAEGRRRLDDPSDFIRAEVAAVLSSGKRVVPVLVGDARYPEPEDLPEELRRITQLQALALSHRHWNTDLQALFRLLDAWGGSPSRSFVAPWKAAFEALRNLGRSEAKEAPAVTQARATDATLVAPKPEPAAPPHQEAQRVSSGKPHAVFLSHAEEDRTRADQVVDALERRGHECFIAHRNIPAGTPSWAGAIVDAIANSQIIVILVTKHSVSSKQVLREVTVADDEKIPLMPLCLDDAPLSRDLKYFFASTQRLQAAAVPWEKALDMIGTAVAQRLSAR